MFSITITTGTFKYVANVPDHDVDLIGLEECDNQLAEFLGISVYSTEMTNYINYTQDAFENRWPEKNTPNAKLERTFNINEHKITVLMELLPANPL